MKERAAEKRKPNCKPLNISEDPEENGDLWDLLGCYKNHSVILCENNIQKAAEALFKYQELGIHQTKIYWAIEELVRLHEHAHHLFFCLRWRSLSINVGYFPFLVQAGELLLAEGKRRKVNTQIEIHKNYEKTAMLRGSLGDDIESKLQQFQQEIIESVQQFVVHNFAESNEVLNKVFNALDQHSPKIYRHWKEIDEAISKNSAKKRMIIPALYNLITAVLVSPALQNATGNMGSRVTLDDLLESIGPNEEILHELRLKRNRKPTTLGMGR